MCTSQIALDVKNLIKFHINVIFRLSIFVTSFLFLWSHFFCLKSIKSGNGLVDIALGKLMGGSYDITTGNGMVQLALPHDIAADFEITTARGAVDSDFPLSKNGRTYAGSINGGGPKIKISTGNGMVSVQKK